MLFLFENTLTHYIYIVFYTLISRAHLAHNPGNSYAMSRHATPTATPSPRSEQPLAHEQPHPNGIKAHNINRFREADGRTIAPSGMPHALHRAPSVPSRTPSPRHGVRQNISTSFALPSPYQWIAGRRLPFFGRGLFKISIRSNR